MGQNKSAKFITYRIAIKLNDFKKKTHLLSLAVHHVPLDSECAGQLCRLFSCDCFCFWLPLKVVDDSFPAATQLCTFWSRNTASQALVKSVKSVKSGSKILEWETWFRNAHSERAHWRKQSYEYHLATNICSTNTGVAFRFIHYRGHWKTFMWYI